MIKLVEVCELLSASKKQAYTLREVFVNPEHVVSLREESTIRHKLLEGSLPEGLDERQQFTKVILNRGQLGLDIIVVGSPQVIESKLQRQTKELLKG